MKPESLFAFNLQTGSLIVVWVHMIGSIPFLVASERLISDCFLFIIIPVNILALYGILNKKPNFLWPQMFIQALDIMIILIIPVFLQLNLYSDPQPPETNVDSWELGLWNSLALRTNYLTKVIGFILILVMHLYFLGIIIQFYIQLKNENANLQRNLANIFLQSDYIFKEPLTQNVFLNDIL